MLKVILAKTLLHQSVAHVMRIGSILTKMSCHQNGGEQTSPALGNLGRLNP